MLATFRIQIKLRNIAVFIVFFLFSLSGSAIGNKNDSPATKRLNADYAHVVFRTSDTNQITSLTTTLIVPPQPAGKGTTFIWPGLQPAVANYGQIGGGVLQPVLTFGPSCAPGKKPPLFSTWWVSSQYVNTKGNELGFTGCLGGKIMQVKPGDVLNIVMTLSGSVWTQTMTNVATKQAVDYSISLHNQPQNIAILMIEEHLNAPASVATFLNTSITFAKADPNNCLVHRKGKLDNVSPPIALQGGKECVIKEIILRHPNKVPNSQ